MSVSEALLKSRNILVVNDTCVVSKGILFTVVRDFSQLRKRLTKKVRLVNSELGNTGAPNDNLGETCVRESQTVLRISVLCC